MTDPLQAAHDELAARYHAADDSDDWPERNILAPLVDVADHLKRVANGTGDHYRAGKTGPLVVAAHAAQLQTFRGYAARPPDGTDGQQALDSAAELLDDLTTVIRVAMRATARGERDEGEGRQVTVRDARDAGDVARRFTAWAAALAEHAVPDEIDN